MAFTLDARDLSYWSRTSGGWVHEPGDFTLSVGASARDIRLTITARDIRLTITVDVTAPPLAVALGAMDHEILSDLLQRPSAQPR